MDDSAVMRILQFLPPVTLLLRTRKWPQAIGIGVVLAIDSLGRMSKWVELHGEGNPVVIITHTDGGRGGQDDEARAGGRRGVWVPFWSKGRSGCRELCSLYRAWGRR